MPGTGLSDLGQYFNVYNFFWVDGVSFLLYRCEV